MANIEINDLNEEITLSEEEVKHVSGGIGYLKLGDIKGESFTYNKSTPILMNKATPQLDSRYGINL